MFKVQLTISNGQRKKPSDRNSVFEDAIGRQFLKDPLAAPEFGVFFPLEYSKQLIDSKKQKWRSGRQKRGFFLSYLPHRKQSYDVFQLINDYEEFTFGKWNKSKK